MCLFSILKVEENSFAKLKYTWKNFITFSNKQENLYLYSIFNWVRFASSFEIDESKLNCIIVSKKEDNFYEIKDDKHNLFEEFYNGAIFSLFIKIKSSQLVISDILKSKAETFLNKLIKDGKLTFLDWLKEPRTQLYPNKDICLLNIIENERLVLKRDNELLIRIRKELGDVETKPQNKYIYLYQIREIEEHYFDKQYKSVIYEFKPSDYDEIISVLNEKHCLLEMIDFITKIKKSIYQFREIYHPNNEKFPNIFSDEIDVSNDFFPLIPYSIFDSNPVIAENNISSENSEGKFLGNLLNILKREELREKTLLGYPHPNTIQGSYLLRNEKTEDAFFPVEFKKDIISKFEYLEYFNEKRKQIKVDIHSAFSIEYIKLSTLLDLIIQKNKSDSIIEKNKFTPKIIYEILYNYHSLYRDKDAHKKLIFDIKDEPQKDTIINLYKSVALSIDKFILNTYSNNHTLSIEYLFCHELIKLDELCVKFWKGMDKPKIKKNTEKNQSLRIDNLDCTELKEFKFCKIKYENESKLILNNETIYYVDELEQNENELHILKAFNNEEYQISKFRITDIPALESNFVYYKTQGRIYLFLIIDNSIVKSYQTIVERRETYLTRQIHIECFENPTEVDKIILTSQKYKHALQVLKHHYHTSDIFKTDKDIEFHLINWLRLFAKNPEDVRFLLEVIATHQTVNPKDVLPFKNEISDFQNKPNCILFSIKTLDDANGLQRFLFYHYGNREIINQMSKFKDKILQIDETQNDNILIILADIGITGSQMINGLEDYYLNREPEENNGKKILKKDWEKYHTISIDELQNFRCKLKSFSKVKFVLIAYTERFRETLTKYIKNNFNKSISVSFFPNNPNLLYANCILDQNPNISIKSRENFEYLIQDKLKLKRIFEFSEEIEKKYDEKLQEADKNLVVRLNSIPNKACMIFNLKPKNEVKPLFNKIK